MIQHDTAFRCAKGFFVRFRQRLIGERVAMMDKQPSKFIIDGEAAGFFCCDLELLSADSRS